MDKLLELINKARDIRDGRHGARYYLSEIEEWLHHDLETLAGAIEEINAKQSAEQEYHAELEKATERGVA